MSPEKSSKNKDRKVVFGADDIYEDPQIGALTEFGRRLQQGCLMSSAILEHKYRAQSGKLPPDSSPNVPETIYGYLREASEYLGVPNDVDFWDSRINEPVERGLASLYGVKTDEPLKIILELPSAVGRKIKAASKKRNSY